MGPKEVKADQISLEDEIIETMMRFGRLLRSHKNLKSLKNVESLTLSQLQILMSIGTEQPTMAQVAQDLELTLPTVSVAIDKLVNAGYVQRHDDPKDRRIIRVGLSKEGARITSKMRKEKAESIRSLISQLSESDKKKTGEVMNALLELLNKRVAK